MTPMARVIPMHPVESPPPALLLAFPRPGDRPSQRRPIPRAGLLLGRGETIFDEPFDDPAMAPRHAEIQLQGKHAVVNDLGSGAGTRLNGATLSESRALVEGDVLRIGDTVFVYTSRERFPAGPGKSTAEQPELTGSTPSIEAVRRSVEAVARHPRTVVVTGETGTGKEIVARLIHRRSGRKGPFVAVNCGGFTEGLLASELFGHVRGAFTGAVGDQQGLFRAAHGGTLLLDEAGEIPLALQPTLLRVLETWQVRPVGSTRDVPVDVRVIAASNRELVTLVRQGLFRPDLYARLAQWIVRLPPLRDRREDIPALSRALLGAARGSGSIPGARPGGSLAPPSLAAQRARTLQRPGHRTDRLSCRPPDRMRARGAERRSTTTASTSTSPNLRPSCPRSRSTGPAWKGSFTGSKGAWRRWPATSASRDPRCTGCSGR